MGLLILIFLVNAQREKINLEESDDEPDFSDLDEEAVLDLPSSEGDEDAEFDMGEEEEDAEAGNWGRNKKTFYSADVAAEDLEEEAAEARKLQKKQLKSLKVEDFGIQQLSKISSGAVTLKFSDSEEEESEADEDLEKDDKYASETELGSLDGKTLDDLLPEEERLALVQKYAPETKKFLQEFRSKAQEIRESIEPTLGKLRACDTHDKGLSFLETKYQMLIGYCANLAYYLLLKVKGKNIERHPVVERLVKYRLLIEKMKPMEAKLQYQIEKLLKAASSTTVHDSMGGLDEDEQALAFRPNLAMMEGSGTEDVSADENVAAYKAPKVAPVHFADKVNQKADRFEEREKMLASKSRLLADVQADVEDRPEEDNIDPVYGRSSAGHSANKQREDYEEENYLRFTLSKKDQRKLEKLQAKPVDELQDLNDFFRERDNDSKNKFSGSKSDLDRLLGTKTRRAKTTGGDDDVPAKKPKYQKQTHKVPVNQDDVDSDMSEIEDDMDTYNQEDDMYKMAKSRSDAKKNFKSNKPVNYRPLRDSQPGTDRPANYTMLKNKGLTPSRPKEVRNPRVHQRQKWERAQKKIKSFKAVTPSSSRAYAGESSGIRTNISRSVKF